jgi:hypothetical protein
LLADLFVGTELFPLDLNDLRRRLQIELAYASYQDAHMNQQSAEVGRQHETEGRIPRIIVSSSNWTDEDLRVWRAEATRRVDAGETFTDHPHGERELTVLAKSLDALLRDRTRIETPLLPPPDIRDPGDPRIGLAQRRFEEGYSDGQLETLVEAIFGRAAHTYDRVMAASFSPDLLALLPTQPQLTLIVCRRGDADPRSREQFLAQLECGPGTTDVGADVTGPLAVCAVVYEGSRWKVTPRPPDWRDRTVRSESRRYDMRLHTIIELRYAVWPHDAPPFLRHGPGSTARWAPVRGRVYDLARDALKKVAADQLRKLVTLTPPQWAGDT